MLVSPTHFKGTVRMKAVILAAGEGTRLRPVTRYVPKPMIRFLGKPFLRYTLENLTGLLDEVVIVVHYREEAIRSCLGHHLSGLRVRYVKQDRLRGTGDGLWSAREFLKGEDRFFVILGDVYVSRKLAHGMMEDSHENLISLAKVDDSEHHLGVDHAAGDLLGVFTGNPWVDRGVWVFSPAIFEYIEQYDGGKGEIRTIRVVERMLCEHVNVGVHLAAEPWIQLGDHSGVRGVLEALRFFLGKAGCDTFCVANRNSSVEHSSVDVAVTDCHIEHSVVFGTGELREIEIANSLVYVNGSVAHRRIAEKIAVL